MCGIAHNVKKSGQVGYVVSSHDCILTNGQDIKDIVSTFRTPTSTLKGQNYNNKHILIFEWPHKTCPFS